MKYVARRVHQRAAASLPSGGAWIEMSFIRLLTNPHGSRSPQGERGLKFPGKQPLPDALGRSPQGERGLKYLIAEECHPHGDVAPLRGSVD